MNKSDSREPAPPTRRAIYGAVIGAASGTLGAILARPLVGAFRDYPPWVLPVIAAGIISALVLAGLLLPLLFRRHPRQ